MKPTLHTAQRPQLRMTPSVQLALEFLQLPALELQSLLDREVTSNPLLEVDDDLYDAPAYDDASVAGVTSADLATGGEADATSASADLSSADLSAAGVASADSASAEIAPADSTAEDAPRDSLDDAHETLFEDAADDGVPALPDDDLFEDPAMPHLFREIIDGQMTPELAGAPSLRDALHGQLRLECRDSELCRIGEYLLGCLDERGYLGLPLTEIAAAMPAPLEQVESALEVVQSLDPAGIAARDLRECLLLQLGRRGQGHSLAARIVREHFDSSLRMARYVLENMGLSQYEAHELQTLFYKLDREAVRDLATLWKPGVPNDKNPEYIARAKVLNRDLEASLMARHAKARERLGERSSEQDHPESE